MIGPATKTDLNIDSALDILRFNYQQWAVFGLRMVNVEEVDRARQFLKEQTPFFDGEDYDESPRGII